MSYIAYINGNLLELSESKPIAQTKQVNDIISLESRQSNFTNTFTAPFTANNIKVMKFVYFVGNESNIPYQKNEFDYIDSDTGQHLIYKGWANVKKTAGKGYEIFVYDGNIDFYKAIENKTMAVLDLSDLDHSKTVGEVLATFDNSKAYKYILADYNGKALYDVNKINIDYLVPSVRISYLIQQIQTYTGFNFEGSVFQTDDYLDLYVTYPKGTDATNVKDLIFTQGETEVEMIGDFQTFEGATGFLNLTAGTIISNLILDNPNQMTLDRELVLSVKIIPAITAFYIETIYDNETGQALYDQEVLVYGTAGLIVDGNLLGMINENEYDILVNANSTIKVLCEFKNTSGQALYNFISKVQLVEIKKNSLGSISFIKEFEGISITDFLKEIVWRFGLTLFKKKFEKVIAFKTIAEITNFENAIDWSSKYIGKQGESYVFGSYAQNNWMRYKYNEDNVSYNDGFLFVDNKNLQDFKTIIQSKIFSPELLPSDSLGFISRIYKLWNKEIKDDGTIVYKELSNRFYFMRSIDKEFSEPVNIGSQSLFGTSQLISSAPVENFLGLSFTEIIIKNYPDIKKILNKSKVINAIIFLTNQDVANIDFSVPYYIEQEASYFMLNKILNFSKKGVTKCELIKLTF